MLKLPLSPGPAAHLSSTTYTRLPSVMRVSTRSLYQGTAPDSVTLWMLWLKEVSWLSISTMI